MQATYDSIHVEDFAKCGAVRDLTLRGLMIIIR